jgi:hypothetical protein
VQLRQRKGCAYKIKQFKPKKRIALVVFWGVVQQGGFNNTTSFLFFSVKSIMSIACTGLPPLTGKCQQTRQQNRGEIAIVLLPGMVMPFLFDFFGDVSQQGGYIFLVCAMPKNCLQKK